MLLSYLKFFYIVNMNYVIITFFFKSAFLSLPDVTISSLCFHLLP